MVGCKTHQPLPPSGIQDQIQDYIQAKAAKSCPAFEKLAADEKFILKDLARLRADQFCLKGPVIFSNYPAWLKNVAVDAALNSAETRKDVPDLTRLALEKSKQPLTPEERLHWAEKAKEWAEQTKDADLQHATEER